MRKVILLLTMLFFYVVHAGDGREWLYSCITIGEDDLWTLTQAAGFVACSPAVSGTTDLHRAAKSGDINSVRRLLGQGVDVNIQDDNGATPLHYAAIINGNEGIVRELLAHEADQKAQNVYGYSPADLAELCGRYDLARLIRHWKNSLDIKEPELA